MAKRKIIKKEAVRKKKKNWFGIVSPKDFGSVFLGESLVEKPDDLIGKTMRLEVSSVMKVGRRGNYEFVFVVKSVRDGKGVTEVKSIGLVSSYIKRTGRKDKTKMEDSFLAETKDGVRVRVKPLVVTKFIVKAGLGRDLRKKIRESLIDYIKKESYVSLVTKVVNSEIQKKIKTELWKIYPLSICEIKILKRV